MNTQLQTIYLAHITKDVPDGADHSHVRGMLGGMGPYGITAHVRTLPTGLQPPHLVTKVGWDEPMLTDLMELSEKEGFQVTNIAPAGIREGVTTYHNKYDQHNRRTQHRYTTAPAFETSDLHLISQLVGPDGANFVIGTVTGWGEMTSEFLQGINGMKGRGSVSAATQGWHRYTDENSAVYQRRVPPELMDEMFGGIDVCVMSDEDISFGAIDSEGNHIPNPEYMQEIADRVGLFVLTQGPIGANVYQNGCYEGIVPSFPLTEIELSKSNPTGLGDTFSAITTREISRGIKPVAALAIAHVVTAAKLAEGPGTILGRGEGMNSLLTTDQLRTFLTAEHRIARVQTYAQNLRKDLDVDIAGLLRDDYNIAIEGTPRTIEGHTHSQLRK